MSIAECPVLIVHWSERAHVVQDSPSLVTAEDTCSSIVKKAPAEEQPMVLPDAQV
jgi:hypothetical protein